MSPVGTPVVRIHIEAETEDCICHRSPGCGGIDGVVLACPEHGSNAEPQGKFHTHAQQVDRISVGTFAL